jgi:hypothetical protein
MLPHVGYDNRTNTNEDKGIAGLQGNGAGT